MIVILLWRYPVTIRGSYKLNKKFSTCLFGYSQPANIRLIPVQDGRDNQINLRSLGLPRHNYKLTSLSWSDPLGLTHYATTATPAEVAFTAFAVKFAPKSAAILLKIGAFLKFALICFTS